MRQLTMSLGSSKAGGRQVSHGEGLASILVVILAGNLITLGVCAKEAAPSFQPRAEWSLGLWVT
jgi:hypothetical protein